MIGAERLLPNCQRAHVKPLGLSAASRAGVDLADVHEAHGNVGMIRPQRLLSNRQYAGKKRLGLCVASFVSV